jgi:hypothetical protein
MSRNEMVSALESQYKARLDRLSLDINNSLNNQGSDTLDFLTDLIEDYTATLNHFNFVQKLKIVESNKKEQRNNQQDSDNEDEINNNIR